MDITASLKRLRLVPVVGLPSVEAGVKLSELLMKYKLPVIEITFRTEHAAAAMKEIATSFPDITIVAGTVLTPEQVDLAVESGAQAIVSPGFTMKLAACCRSREIPFFPGVCTPGEVQQAREEGLYNLKFFPASLYGGTKTLGLFKALYQDVGFMPTGGINQENLHEYLQNDNVLCCGGTWLSPETMMAEGKWDEIENRIREAVKLLAALE